MSAHFARRVFCFSVEFIKIFEESRARDLWFPCAFTVAHAGKVGWCWHWVGCYSRGDHVCFQGVYVRWWWQLLRKSCHHLERRWWVWMTTTRSLDDVGEKMEWQTLFSCPPRSLLLRQAFFVLCFTTPSYLLECSALIRIPWSSLEQTPDLVVLFNFSFTRFWLAIRKICGFSWTKMMMMMKESAPFSGRNSIKAAYKGKDADQKGSCCIHSGTRSAILAQSEYTMKR